MPLNASLVGRSYPPTSSYLVSREKIREFAGAISDPNPVYRDPEVAEAAGYADVIAPPTFAATITQGAFNQVAADPDLGLEYARMVHGEQAFSYRRPVVAGDRVHVTVSVADITSRRGNDFLTLHYDVSTEAGEPVLTAKALLVFRVGDEPTGEA